MKLHIGGTEAREGWSVLNAQPAECVDVVGNILDIPLEDGTCEYVYSSHVLEHLSYQNELKQALDECHRILIPGGKMMVSVPDLDVICGLFRSPHIGQQEQFHLMRILMGGQTDSYDFHKTGFTAAILYSYLAASNFSEIEKVAGWGLFEDCSVLNVFGAQISLNVEATKL